MKEITIRQAQALRFVGHRIATGMPPTLREIGAAMGIVSTNGVNDSLLALEKKGYIRRDAKKSRAIRLTTLGADFVGQPMLASINEDPGRAQLLERLYDVAARWYTRPTDSPTGVFEAVRAVMAYDNKRLESVA